MTIIHKILVSFLSTTFRLLLVSSLGITACILLFTNSDYIKTVLQETNTYDNFIPALIETNKDRPLGGKDSIKLGDEIIAQIIVDAIPKETVRTGFEQVITSVYDWLEGDVNELEFEISLGRNKQSIAEGLADYAIARSESLPICQTYTSASIDPFTAQCLPTGLDISSQRDKLVSEFNENTPIIDETIINDEQIIQKESRDEYRNLPSYYQLLKPALLVIAVVLGLLATLIIFVARNKKEGVRKLAKGLTGATTSIIFFTILFSFVLPYFTGNLPILSSGGTGIDSLINDISLRIGRDFALQLIILCTPLLTLGIVLLYLTKKKPTDKYGALATKSGMSSSNEPYKRPKSKKSKKNKRPPIQSSDVAEKTKPIKKSRKYKKYRTIAKKEMKK